MLNVAAFLAVPKLNQVWRDWRGHGRKFASNPRLSELTAIYEELAVARLRMGLEALESRWLASVELTHHDHVIMRCHSETVPCPSHTVSNQGHQKNCVQKRFPTFQYISHEIQLFHMQSRCFDACFLIFAVPIRFPCRAFCPAQP